MATPESVEAFVTLVFTCGLLLFGLKLIAGRAFRWIFPIILIIAALEVLPETPATQAIWNLIGGLAGPLLLTYILFSSIRHIIFGPSRCNCREKSPCTCSHCRGS